MALELQQWAFFLQLDQNRQHARMRLAEEGIKKITYSRWPELKGFGLEEKRLHLLSVDERAREWDAVRAGCEVRISQAVYLTARADALAKTLLAVAKGENHE